MNEQAEVIVERDPEGTLTEGASDERETLAGPTPSVPPEEHSLPTVPPPAVLRLLGSGGMATVHLARDASIDRDVALKRLHPEKATSPERRADFVQEARILGQLQHPAILPVFQLAVDDDGAVYFTTEVIDGRPLRQWLAEPSHRLGTRARLTEGLEVVLRVADAVAYAHGRGVIHRDIKPDNIMVGRHGRVHLVDWGIALRPVAEGSDAAHRYLGTPGYLAPEQARSEPIDERVDVFGLGAVLFKILTGELPYRVEAGDLSHEAKLGRVIPTRTYAPAGTPVGLIHVCDRALAPDKDDRYRSVEEFQTDLRRVLGDGVLLPQRSYAAGSMVLKEGDLGEEAFLLLKGRCRVTQGAGTSQRTLRTMGEGELFGELALLLDEPRSASVVAETAVTVLVMDRKALETSGALHGFPSALLKSLARRFRELEKTNQELRAALAATEREPGGLPR